MTIYYVFGLFTVALILYVWHSLYPKPLRGIPYNEHSAKRAGGDLSDLVAQAQKTNEFGESMYSVTTRALGTPIAQLLFTGFKKPFVILEDAREVEDIIIRRGKEFDKSSAAADNFALIFPHAAISQLSTPQCKAQKRVWADVMSTEFLRKTAAPKIYEATLELLELWRLKASTVHKDQPFNTLGDVQDTVLDAVWVAIAGQEAGIIRHEMTKLRMQLEGSADISKLTPPPGHSLKKEVVFAAEALSASLSSPLPQWALKLLSHYGPSFRRHRAVVKDLIVTLMKAAVTRFHGIEVNDLETGEADTCMMDLVLRRQVIEAKKADKPVADPANDPYMLEDMFVMLSAGFESTANALSWFIRIMDTYPAVQSELRQVLMEAFDNSKTPTVVDLLGKNIPYLEAIIEEAFRFGGTAKITMRKAMVDTEILGYPIPKGSEVTLKLHLEDQGPPVSESKRTESSRSALAKYGDGLHGQAGRDLGRFNPYRWLTKDAETGKDVFNPHALPSYPFGGGARGCPGRKLALMEFRVVIVLLILNLEFLELPDHLKSIAGHETVFRKPLNTYSKMRTL